MTDMADMNDNVPTAQTLELGDPRHAATVGWDHRDGMEEDGGHESESSDSGASAGRT